MNNGLPHVKLNDICRPTQWPTIPQSAMTDDGYPVYGANGRIGFYSEYNHEEPTVLITCRGATCGTINVCEPKSYVTGNAMALDELDIKRADLRFVAYALNKRGLRDAITGSAQPQITRTSLSGVEIPLPPLSEQKRIADILDKADAIRRKRQEALREYSCIVESVFHEMFGDPVAGSSNLATEPFEYFTTRITYGFTCPMSHHPEGIPILTAKNIQQGFIDFDNVHYADQSEFDALTAKCKPNADDILITKDGSIGRCAVVEVDFPICINQSVALVQPDHSRVTSEYLASFIRSRSVQRVLQGMHKGNALKHLQITELAQLPVPNATLEQQKTFADRVRRIRSVATTFSDAVKEHGYSPAQNSKELAAIIESVFCDQYSVLDCCRAVLCGVFPNHKGIKKSTRSTFQNAHKGEIDDKVPAPIREALANTSEWYSDYQKYLRNETYSHLKEITDLLDEAEDPILMLWDGLDKPLGQKNLTGTLWDQMRDIVYGKKHKIVTATRAPLDLLISNEDAITSEFWNIFDSVYVRPFDSTDQDMLVEMAQLTLAAGGRTEVDNWAAGHPRLLLELLNRLVTGDYGSPMGL